MCVSETRHKNTGRVLLSALLMRLCFCLRDVPFEDDKRPTSPVLVLVCCFFICKAQPSTIAQSGNSPVLAHSHAGGGNSRTGCCLHFVRLLLAKSFFGSQGWLAVALGFPLGYWHGRALSIGTGRGRGCVWFIITNEANRCSRSQKRRQKDNASLF